MIETDYSIQERRKRKIKKERFTLPFVPQLLCIYYNKQVFDYQLFIEGMEGFYGEETEW